MTSKKRAEKRRERKEIAPHDPHALNPQAWRPHMCQFFREAVLRVSREELAKMINVRPGSIFNWENPKMKSAPNRENLTKLCRVFGCEFFELYSDFDPDTIRQFLEDVFKTWSFVLQKAMRAESVSEQRFALHLTQLFMDYDERRRNWEAQDPKDEESMGIENELDKIMFGASPEINGSQEPDIEEGSEIDALPAPPNKI